MGEKGDCFWGELPLRGLLDWGREDAAFGGAHAARSCWDGGGRRLLLGGGGGGGGSRCAGLLDRERKKAALGGGAPAAWGCPIEGVRRLLWGELPLRGAARLGEGGCCVWGSSRCAELLGWGREDAAFGGELPLRGAARLREGGGCFGEISRCAGLLDREREEAAALGGAPAARGCSIRSKSKEGRGCSVLGRSRCAGLLDREREEAAFGGAPAARGCSIRRMKEEAASSGGAPAARSCWDGGGRRLILEELPPPCGRRILILAGTTGPGLKNTNSSKKPVKVSIYTNSSEIGESMSPLWITATEIRYPV